MTWEEIHEEIIKKLLKGHFSMPHGCVSRDVQKQDPNHELYQPRTCIWILKAPKPHVSFVKDVAEVSQWYDSFNGVKISLADPNALDKIEKEIWQTDL
jgi:hypothetical protein